MADKKEGEKKDLDTHQANEPENKESILDGKGLHDLYRHTTKLIK